MAAPSTRVTHWIGGGAATMNREAAVLDVPNPATGRCSRVVEIAARSVVDDAVRQMIEPARDWASTPLAPRTRVLFRFHALLLERREELAHVITSEHGKTLGDALGEVDRGIENVEYACGLAELLKGVHSTEVTRGVDVYSRRQALGVVAGITPFNFPAMVPLWMMSNALACGNAFVLKPSEKAPSAALLLADTVSTAGLPDNVFNVVNGDANTAEVLTVHPDIAAVSFVGSTPVARSVYATATAAGKRVQALGGAKNHLVVLPDADLELAADAAVSAAFGSAGERCMATSVLVAVGPIADELVDAIAQRIARIAVGRGDDPTTDMGPLISAAHRARVCSFLEPTALGDARLVVDGRVASVPDRGFFIGCSLVDGVEPGTPVYDEEIFGPVLGVVRVPTMDDALDLVARSRFGNGVSVFTRSGVHARDFEVRVDAGMVGINVPVPVPVSSFSFGGWGDSLFGDLHMYGPEGVLFYTKGKVVTSRWPYGGTTAGMALHFPSSIDDD